MMTLQIRAIWNHESGSGHRWSYAYHSLNSSLSVSRSNCLTVLPSASASLK